MGRLVADGESGGEWRVTLAIVNGGMGFMFRTEPGAENCERSYECNVSEWFEQNHESHVSHVLNRSLGGRRHFLDRAVGEIVT